MTPTQTCFHPSYTPLAPLVKSLLSRVSNPTTSCLVFSFLGHISPVGPCTRSYLRNAGRSHLLQGTVAATSTGDKSPSGGDFARGHHPGTCANSPSGTAPAQLVGRLARLYAHAPSSGFRRERRGRGFGSQGLRSTKRSVL
jgi:hypothetical protein